MVETDETILGGSKTYYTEPCTSMNLKGITTTTRTIRCTSCGRSHEDWNHFWKCPKVRKDARESTQQRTRINARANMKIHHNSTNPNESIDRKIAAEKHKHRHNGGK